MEQGKQEALEHTMSGASELTTSSSLPYYRPAPPTPTYSVRASTGGANTPRATFINVADTPRSTASARLGRPGHAHKRTLSQAPDPLPKTDPWRKETGWNLSGCVVYALFLAAYIFYYYVRIRYTLVGALLWYSVLILIFELLASSSMVIHGLCLLRVRLPRKSEDPVPAQPYVVRVLIPCYTESLAIVSKTVLAAANAVLPAKACRTVYLLDDGKDVAKAQWVAEQGREDIVYISGRVRQKGETNGKACNLNHTLTKLYPAGVPVDDNELVVIFDADMVCFPDFFVKILAELYDPQVAIVLTPQKFHNYNIDCDIFNHSNLIYWQVSLPGLDGWDNVSCTGTNFVVRARAASEAGWFPTYTLGEDMALALEIQKEGWKGAYVKEYLAIGEVPETVRNAFMQKSRWCKGGMQIFFSKHNAMFASNLSIMQRIVWNTSGWSYICTTLTTPVFLVIPVIGVWAGYFPLQFNWWFALAFTIYSPCCYLLLYYCRSPSHLRSIYFSIVAAHMFWFAYAKATFNTIFATVFGRKIHFKTTEKSVMSTTVVDLANKAKQKVANKSNVLRTLWSQVQDIWIHLLVFLICLVSAVVAIVQLAQNFDPHTWQSVSVLVSIGWLTYNMMAPAMLLYHCLFGNRFLTQMCTVISLFTALILAAIIVIIWIVLPHEYDYKTLLGDSLSFYDAQRSGVLPADNPIYWRGNSALTDKAPNGASLVGGFYDDGGAVKNGFSLAATVALLAWGMLEFPSGFAKAGQTQHALDTLKWGTDYMLACNLNTTARNGTTYVAQVGDYVLDAAYWGRPELMTMARPAYVVNNTAPGSDLLGSSAAGLAAAAVVFNSTNQTYAQQLVSTAEILYRAGATHLGSYSDSIFDVRYQYPSSGYLDDLAWGAAWLYKATDNVTYLQESQQWFSASQANASQIPVTPLAWNWDNQLPGTAVLLANFSGFTNQTLNTEIKAFLDAWVEATDGILRTASYLSYVGPDGALRNTANVALLARIYQGYTNGKTKFDCWSEFQARAMLGDARRSYVVGTANNSPLRPDHKAASCAGNYTTPCPANAQNSTAANPWVLQGALVSGPYLADDADFLDVRTEPDNRITIEYNAGFTGLLAALAEQDSPSYTHCSQGHGFIYGLSNKSPV